MRTVNNLLQAFLKIDIGDVADKALIEVEDDYAIAQREQMSLGLASDDKIIGEYKNPDYKARKEIMNPVAKGKVDLRDKLDFSKGIFAIPDNEGLVVGSFDLKSASLEEKYGDRIWLLRPVKKNEFIQSKLAPATLTIVVNKLK